MAEMRPDNDADQNIDDSEFAELENAGKKRGPTKKPSYEHNEPLTEVPTDYDFDKHAALKQEEFVGPKPYYLYKAEKCEFDARKYREKAEEADDKFDPDKDKKKLQRLRDNYQKLIKRLEAQGIDISALEESNDDDEDDDDFA